MARKKAASKSARTSQSAKGRRRTAKRKTTAEDKRWSARVTRESDALDLERDVFKSDSPRRIALSLKGSAEASKRRKSSPYRSAMSMLTFYINRAGKNLSAKQRSVLDRAKDELRKAFGRA
ncbi:MAG TPA: DUF3175 domain-containing protein [Alphaproteobacteria bacterium]